MEPAGGAAAWSTVTTPRVAEVQVEEVGEELVVEKVEVVVEDEVVGAGSRTITSAFSSPREPALLKVLESWWYFWFHEVEG